MARIVKSNMSAFGNFLLAKYEAYTGAVRVQSRPCYAMIDVCDVCQLRCPTCPTGIENEGRRLKIGADTRYRAKRSKLTPELYDALLEEMGEYLFLATFHSWGEPLLNKHLATFVRQAKDRGIHTETHTNLSLPLSDARIEELLESGLDLLIASVDGFSQEAYEKFRVGGNIGLVKRNLERAAAIRDRNGLENGIVYKFIVFSWNEHEVELARQYAEDHGLIFLVQDAYVPDASWLPSYRKGEKPFLSEADVEELDRQWQAAGKPGYWREHERHAGWLPVHPGQNWVATDKPRADSFCGWHYDVAVIQPGGQLAPCCFMAKEEDRFGTVVPEQVSLGDVWNNENFRKSRAAFAGEEVDGLEDTDTVCCRCYLPDAVMHTYSAYDAEVIQRYLALLSDADPVITKAFEILLGGEDEANRRKFTEYFRGTLMPHVSGDRGDEAASTNARVASR